MCGPILLPLLLYSRDVLLMSSLRYLREGHSLYELLLMVAGRCWSLWMVAPRCLDRPRARRVGVARHSSGQPFPWQLQFRSCGVACSQGGDQGNFIFLETRCHLVRYRRQGIATLKFQYIVNRSLFFSSGLVGSLSV